MRIGVLPGGGAHGAIQVGMLKGAMESGHPGFHGYTTISVGTIDGIELAMHRNFKDGVTSLVKKWLELDTSDVYKHHLPLSYAHGLWTPNVYDTSPLVRKMTNELDHERLKSSGVKLRVGAWSTRRRKLDWFSEDHPLILPASLASSAMPFFFAPIMVGDEQYVDGGIDTVTPLAKAIQMGATEIDIFMTTADDLEYNDPPWENVFDAGRITIEALIANVQRKDFKVAQLYNRLVAAGLEPNKREIKIRRIKPAAVPSTSPLDFSNAAVKEMMNIGEDSWKKAVG